MNYLLLMYLQRIKYINKHNTNYNNNYWFHVPMFTFFDWLKKFTEIITVILSTIQFGYFSFHLLIRPSIIQLSQVLCIRPWMHIFFSPIVLLFFLLPENYSTFLNILHTYLFHNHDSITMNNLTIHFAQPCDKSRPWRQQMSFIKLRFCCCE
jgi:hypothetical protein